MATMNTLVEKYAGGYEEWERQNASRIALAANAIVPLHDAAASVTSRPERNVGDELWVRLSYPSPPEEP